MTRIYTTTFAATGDKETLATTDPGTGKVSLPSGWTPDYEKLDSDPSYRPVGRKEMNGVMNEVTAAVGELQQYGFAPWQALAGGWPLNARAVSGGIVYKSTSAANTATPPAAPWVVDAATDITAAPAKAVPVNADKFGVTDSAASFGLASMTWGAINASIGIIPTSRSNTKIGDAALQANTTGIGNTANGQSALYSNTTGSGNTASGVSALQANTTGNYNTASGQGALLFNTTGSSNTASGREALYANTTGVANTACGHNALYSNTTGDGNTASGQNALAANTTGYNNTASGHVALYSNTTGGNNTASGVGALISNTTGSGNTAINPRNSAGSYAPVFNPTTENNRFCMGSTGVTNAYIQVAWTVVSDARDKTDFAPVPHGLDFVKKLKTTAYRYKMTRADTEGHGPVRYGFKAQEVLALEGSNPVIVDAEDAEKLRFNDQAMIAVLVNALQELNAKFDAYVSTNP